MYFRYIARRISFQNQSFRWSIHISRNYCHPSKAAGWEQHPFLSTEHKLGIEQKWKEYVDNFGFSESDTRPKAYILSMFPYPSGKLHMGHVRVYTISDTLARFYRMLGYNVLHPMGWDAFGLPAENAAIEGGEDPALWTEKNISIMRSQLKNLGCSFDWDRELATCNPNYYKWTQYIFLEMFKAGLAYRKPSLVNWDPIDKTVLADEQIDENGKSWRSGAKAEKILKTQWFIRSTKFSQSLRNELENFRKEDWFDVISLQREWIGEVNGSVVDWKLEGASINLSLPIWTDKLEHVHKAGFIAVTPGSMLDVMQPSKSFMEFEYKTVEGELTTFKAALLSFKACNPFSQEKVPVYVVEGVLPFLNGSDSYLGIPSEVEIDSIFSKCVGISSKSDADGSIKSEHLTSESLCAKAQQMGIGGYATSSKLKDWLISRQRYWGTPIPIIHCLSCGAVPVPKEQLPVKLPSFPSKKEISNELASPLAQATEWLNTSCPKCGGPASRETDTMDTFVDSSWYYMRYIDPSNDEALVNFQKAKEIMPVNVYIGGKEHATLHLYYARIVSHFLHQLGITPCPEPFQRLLVQGMVMGQTFIDKETGRYLKRNEIEFRGKEAFNSMTGKPVIVRWDKMSKSKHNGVDPADAIRSFGVDTTRLLMLADAAPFSQRNWDPEGSKGVLNWQNNLYILVSRFLSNREKAKSGMLKCDPSAAKYSEDEDLAYQLRNQHLSAITFNYRTTHQFMVAIKSMQALTKKLKLLSDEVVAFSPKFEEALATLIITVAPMAPHFASELWQGFVSASGRLNQNSSQLLWEKSVLEQLWPSVDSAFKLPFHVNVNGREICRVMVPNQRLKTLDKNDLLQLALEQEEVKKILQNKMPEIQDAFNIPEREAVIRLLLKGVKISEEESMPSYTKKARQALAKQKRIKKANETS